MISSKIKTRVHNFILETLNVLHLRPRLRHTVPKGNIPVFLIVTPDLVHIIPFVLSHIRDPFFPVLVGNGISVEDRQWLPSVLEGKPVFQFKTTLRGNRNNLLAHGAAIDCLWQAWPGHFCLQDPDCFVTNPSFFHQVTMDDSRHYAAGPFHKRVYSPMEWVPETYFLLLNRKLVRRVKQEYGASAKTAHSPSEKATDILDKAGYPTHSYPEPFKDYFDTFQIYWLIAAYLGFSFKKLDGAEESVVHIGGMSYLHKTSDIPLDHWDYWPLNVHYLTLRLLELPELRRFLPRFEGLVTEHGDADTLIRKHPEYKLSQRYGQTEMILSRCCGLK